MLVNATDYLVQYTDFVHECFESSLLLLGVAQQLSVFHQVYLELFENLVHLCAINHVCLLQICEVTDQAIIV